MTIKKTLTSLLAVSIMAAAVAGCTPTQTTINDKDEQGRTVISVGNWPATEGEYLTRITKQKAEFEEANPTMAIEPDTWTFDLKSFYSKAAGGQLPGLYYANFTEMEKIAAGEYYTDIKDGIKRAGYEGQFDERLMKLMNNKNLCLKNSSYSSILELTNKTNSIGLITKEYISNDKLEEFNLVELETEFDLEPVEFGVYYNIDRKNEVNYLIKIIKAIFK